MIINIFRKYYALILILFLATFFIFYNLDNGYLWKDEAYTAEVGCNVLKFGYPRVWDGKNIMTGSAGNDFNNDFAIINQGWLQFYIVAFSIKLLGENTLAARLPFALFGLFTVVVIWFLAKKIFHKRYLADLTTFYCTCYVPFLLYVRQVRYYSLIFFFITLSTLFFIYVIDSYRRINEINTRKISLFKTCLGLSVAMIFYSNHLFGLIWCTCSFIFLLLYHHKLIIKVYIPIGIGILLWLPWFFYTNINSQIQSGYSISKNFVLRILIILWKIQVYFFPFIILGLLLAAIRMYLFSKKKSFKNIFVYENMFFLILIFVNVVAVAAIEFFIINHYLLGIVVAVPFILTVLTSWLVKNNKLAAIIIMVLIITSNISNICPYFFLDKSANFNDGYMSCYMSKDPEKPTVYNLIASPSTLGDAALQPLDSFLDNINVRWYLFDYLKELFNDYDSPNEEIVKILKKNSLPDERVLIQGIEEEPIMFYTDLRVVNNLSQRLRPWNNYYENYPNLKYAFLTHVADKDIDWIIIRKGDKPLIFDDLQYLEKNIKDFYVFQSTTIDMPLSNSADLDYHKFETVKEGDRFYLLHRRK